MNLRKGGWLDANYGAIIATFCFSEKNFAVIFDSSGVIEDRVVKLRKWAVSWTKCFGFNSLFTKDNIQFVDPSCILDMSLVHVALSKYCHYCGNVVFREMVGCSMLNCYLYCCCRFCFPWCTLFASSSVASSRNQDMFLCKFSFIW